MKSTTKRSCIFLNGRRGHPNEGNKLKHRELHKFKPKAKKDQYKFNIKLGETLDNAKFAAQKAQL